MLQQFDQLYAQFKEAGVDNEATFGGYRLVYINVPEEDRPRRKRCCPKPPPGRQPVTVVCVCACGSTHDIELYLPGETTNPLRSVKAARAHLSGTVGTPMSATEAPGAAVAMEAGADAPSLAMDEDGDEAGSAGELERPNVAVEALLAIDRARGDGCKRRLMDGNLLYVHVTEEGVEWMLHIMQREGVRVIRDLKTLGEFYGVTGDVRKAAALREEFCARPGVRGGRPDSPSLAFLEFDQPAPPIGSPEAATAAERCKLFTCKRKGAPLPCGHRICRPCVEGWLSAGQSNSDKCPTCRTVFDVRELGTRVSAKAEQVQRRIAQSRASVAMYDDHAFYRAVERGDAPWLPRKRNGRE